MLDREQYYRSIRHRATRHVARLLLLGALSYVGGAVLTALQQSLIIGLGFTGRDLPDYPATLWLNALLLVATLFCAYRQGGRLKGES